MATKRKAQVLAAQGDGPDEKINIFFSRLREKRVELGFSQTELGKKIGLSQQMMALLENGSFPRDPARVAALADALGVSLDWLFGRDD